MNFANSFFFLLQALAVLTHVLTFFFFFSSAFFMRIGRFFVIWLRRYFDPPKSPEHTKQFQKFFSLPVIRFSAMLRVVKMDQGATDICCWWYVFMQMGTHHLKHDANGQFSQFWFTPSICFSRGRGPNSILDSSVSTAVVPSTDHCEIKPF